MTECKACGGRVIFIGDPMAKVRAATSYASAAHECSTCGLRYSNSANAATRTAFTQSPAGNVPADIAQGLDVVLAASMNEVNRLKKADWFCASTSEDAVTWSVFRWLIQAGRASLLPELCLHRKPEGEPALLLWGAPAGGDEAESLRDHLIAVSDCFGEDPRRRTEMDVLLVWPDLVIVVEVKYRSPNDRKPGTCGARLPKYVREELFAVGAAEIDRVGYYELARNWALGAVLAERLRRPFLLVNLGPKALRSDVEALRPQLRSADDHHVAFVAWGELTAAIERDGPAPEWLLDYFSARELGVGGAYA